MEKNYNMPSTLGSIGTSVHKISARKHRLRSIASESNAKTATVTTRRKGLQHGCAITISTKGS
ncbi:hypothetical protein C2845_PM17G10540 [Panicum miliaceum]|uniref:Uncharacterized protein n=1 Tax=Panicum miliaceum TaxID=4540 RepID=A0A3L6PZU0_PANMI|nr:hypothetical protein C2845_PM17G10540 [Panicum miliaceum]